MAAKEGQAPIIIKKIKKGGHGGHHGGAWKVAYADFVTAMMAFFLLMWLLNATEAEQLAGLADYFSPTVGLKGEMGIGFRGGKGPLTKGTGADKNTNKGIVHGGMPSGPVVKVNEQSELPTDLEPDEKITITEAEKKMEEDKKLSEAQQQLESAVAGGGSENEESQNVDIVISPEGLEIRLVDRENRPMFMPGSSELQPHVKKILEKVAEIVSFMPNYISISGHTNSVNQVTKDGQTSWEVSIDRANVTRRYLVANGVQNDQIARVMGKADNEPLDVQNPESSVNKRISIVMLRQSVLAYNKKSAPDAVFVDTKTENFKKAVDENVLNEPEQKKVDTVKQNREKRKEEIRDVIKALEMEEKIDEEILRDELRDFEGDPSVPQSPSSIGDLPSLRQLNNPSSGETPPATTP